MHIIVGTAGHIDHGKTALIRALTGTDMDRLPEEKRRGITVDLGFAELTAGDLTIGFVDVPGHQRFVRNMVAGAAGIDLVILTVAADDGVMPQTREHFEICRMLGVQRGIIAITKTDIVDAETLEIARLDIAELVAGSFLANAPVVPVSSLTNDGIPVLIDQLVRLARERSPSAYIARLPIDRCFTMKGFGTVVTGTLVSGTINEGDELELLPQKRRVRVRGLQSYGRTTSTAVAGTRTAVNLAAIDHSDIERGMLLAEPGVLEPSHMLDVSAEVLRTAERPLRTRQRVRLHIGTAEVLARVRVLDAAGSVEVGASAFLQLTLETPVAAVPGERFILRSYSPQTTIAGGVVVHNAPPRHRLPDFPAIASFLTQLSEANPENSVSLLVENAGRRGIRSDRLRAHSGLALGPFKSALARLASVRKLRVIGDLVISEGSITAIRDDIETRLSAFHAAEPLAKGMTVEALRATLRATPEVVVNGILDELALARMLVFEGETVRLAAFSSTLSADEELVSTRILTTIRNAGCEAEKISAVLERAVEGIRITEQTAKDLLQMHADARRIVKVSDAFYFSSESIDALIGKMREYADASPDRLIDVGEFKEIAGLSRKYAIPLLEYFDRENITARAGEKRIVR